MCIRDRGSAASEEAVLFRAHPQGEKLYGLLGRFEEMLTAEIDLKEGFDFNSFQEDLKSWRERVAGQLIELALEITYGNQVKAAELLRITPRALRYYLEKTKQEA